MPGTAACGWSSGTDVRRGVVRTVILAVACGAVACGASRAAPVRAEPARPAADRFPRGVLDALGNGFLPGTLAAVPELAGGRETLAWRSPAFTTPFEFFLDEIVGVRFGPAPQPLAANAWRVCLRGGGAVVGTLDAIDAETVTLTCFGKPMRLRRAAIEQIGRAGAGGGGAVPVVGWTQVPAGSWHEDAGGWATRKRGAALQRDLAVGGRTAFDIVLAWEKTPAFRLAFAADERKGEEPYRIELFSALEGVPADNLLVIREEGTRAAIKTVADVVPAAARERLPAGRLRLTVFVDQARGRLAVALPDTGDEAAVIDISLPPDAGRRPSAVLRLTSGGDVRLDSVRLSRWTDEAAALPRRTEVTLSGVGGPLAAGDLETLDVAAGELVMREPGGPRRVPLADVVEMLFPVAGDAGDQPVKDGPPPVRVACLHDQSLAGRLLKIDEAAVWLATDAFLEPVAVPHPLLVSLVGGRRAAAARPLPGRVGTLRTDTLELRGCLVAAPKGMLAWQPLGSRSASGFVTAADAGPDGVVEYVVRQRPKQELDAGGREQVGGMGGAVNHDGQGRCVVTRLSGDGAAAQDGRIEVGDMLLAVAPEEGSDFVETKGLELNDVFNLLRGRVGSQVRVKVVDGDGMNPREVDLLRGPLGFSGQALQEALETHERLAPTAHRVAGPEPGMSALLFLRTGDIMPCAVAGIDADGIRIRTAPDGAGDPLLVPAADVKAVELIPKATRRNIELTRRERLLTVPRAQRFDPPTHIVRLVDGDYIRGQIDGLDDQHLTIAVPPGEKKRLPRATVARVIWLHPEELDADARQARAKRPVGTIAQGVSADGTRLTLAVDDMREGSIRGRIAAIGPGAIDVERVDRVLLGSAVDREAIALPYRQWKLKPAPEPRALRVRPDADSAEARPRSRIPLSPLAGKQVPRVTLPVIDAAGQVTGRGTATPASGRVLVLEFWSEWSAPSRETLPAVAAAVARQPAGTVDLLAVSVGDKPAKAAAALAALNLRSTAVDADRSVAAAFDVREVPARVLISPDGLVIDVLSGDGPQAVEEFTALLATAVAASRPLRAELAALADARSLAERGDRDCLDRILPLLSSPHRVVRRETLTLLRGVAPGAVPVAAGEPAQQADADGRLDREAAAWRTWIAREGSVARLRQPPKAGRDQAQPEAKELGRLLVCMTHANQIGEFDPEGRKLWGRAFRQPAACVGLPNGHRLVASAAQQGLVVEFNGDGKEVWRLADLPAGVTSVARLADGKTLVGFADASRVAEYDPDGTVVWEATVLGRPCAVARLPAGTTLVACQESDRIVELDRDGTEVAAFEDLDGLQDAVRLANGHLLVTMSDKVVELGTDGEVLWSKEGFNGATSADRLADGRTLVLEPQAGVVVELDATGQERSRKRLRGGHAAMRLDAY